MSSYSEISSVPSSLEFFSEILCRMLLIKMEGQPVSCNGVAYCREAPLRLRSYCFKQRIIGSTPASVPCALRICLLLVLSEGFCLCFV